MYEVIYTVSGAPLDSVSDGVEVRQLADIVREHAHQRQGHVGGCIVGEGLENARVQCSAVEWGGVQ